MKRVCLVSSGTGGHLWPAFALSQALRARGHETVLVTEGRGVERLLLQQAGGEAEALDLRGKGLAQLPRMLSGALEARRILKRHGAEAVIGTGGRTSVAVALAGRSLGLPVCLLEQNAVTGRANRLLSHFAERLYLGLPTDDSPRRAMLNGVSSRRAMLTGVNSRRAMLTGTPLRAEFGAVDRAEARRRLAMPDDATVVMVTGGSQGAEILNQMVPPALAGLQRPLLVSHLAGQDRAEAVAERYASSAQIDARVKDVTVDMATEYSAADLVVCRGGGCTVAELSAIGRPALIVPYPHHRDRQQSRNGMVLERAGAARVLEQTELDSDRLQSELEGLLADPARLAEMAAAAKSIAPDDPCAVIVEDLETHILT